MRLTGLRTLLLAASLLWTQLLLAAHGLEHAFPHADDDGVCVICLELAGMQNGHVATPLQVAQSPLPPLYQGDSVSCASTFQVFHAFRSRAPPGLQSR